VERPVYFQYPSGFPMVPFKRSDGAVAADIAGGVFPTAVSVYSPCEAARQSKRRQGRLRDADV
jgi:hypothetical protein